ncbi:hypothetical protein COO60DRAFT_354991 [Scenedesmus sp. NREL 46B-D3]|nr:hypothetical protein COO60DRAFT_354991 [Scenedesmus sp. NREL 46B-D3]
MPGTAPVQQLQLFCHNPTDSNIPAAHKAPSAAVVLSPAVNKPCPPPVSSPIGALELASAAIACPASGAPSPTAPESPAAALGGATPTPRTRGPKSGETTRTKLRANMKRAATNENNIKRMKQQAAGKPSKRLLSMASAGIIKLAASGGASPSALPEIQPAPHSQPTSTTQLQDTPGSSQPSSKKRSKKRKSSSALPVIQPAPHS